MRCCGMYITVWDNVSFHSAVQELFSIYWCLFPYTRENLLQAKELTCDDTNVKACQACIWHGRVFFALLACNVDEILWTGPASRHDAEAEWLWIP